jgi:hypothetical protein
MNIFSVSLVAFGLWLIIDGVGSIIKYHYQTIPEHLVRVIRATVGVAIIIIGITEN